MGVGLELVLELNDPVIAADEQLGHLVLSSIALQHKLGEPCRLNVAELVKALM
jgi:hypothetical protein